MQGKSFGLQTLLLNGNGDNVADSPSARRGQLRQEIPNVDQVVVEDLLRIVQQAKNSRLANRIEHVLCILPPHDNIAFPQDGQLLRERTLLNVQPYAQVVHSDLAISQSA